MARLVQFITLALIYLQASLASAAEPGSRVVEPISVESVSQMILGLILVVALIFFLAWALRRVNAVPGQSGQMRIIGSLPLGTRERIILVQVGEEQLLLGVTAQAVQLLARYEEPIISAQEVQRGEFAGKLAQVLQDKGIIK